MALDYHFLKSTYDNVLYIIRNITIKREDLARANATTESYAAWEMYLAAVKGDTNFYNYLWIPADAIRNSNIPQYMKQRCIDNKNNIPEEYREEVVKTAIPMIIEQYEELNEYYRVLNGLPSPGDSVFYNTEYDDIPKDIPLHELGSEYIALLEQRHAIDVLRERYPDRYYLNYLGVRKIDLISAHIADPFDILYCPYPENDRVREAFLNNYHWARRYVMTCCYNKNMFTDRPMLDPFIGFVILMLAVRNTLVPDEEDYLSYEEIINACLESYGMLGFFRNLPFSYKKRLVLAMDSLLQYKGTDKVLVDVMKIFNLDNYTVYRYYLLKTHKLDSQTGEPLFPTLEDGTPDYDNMYDLRFLKKDIASEDIEIKDELMVEYEAVTEDDSLWQVNSEEYTKVMESEFNLMMSKYISIDIAYDITKLMYEINFFVNLILNSRANVATIITSNMYAEEGSSDAYTLVVFMLAAMAKRTGYDGNIVYTPDQVAEIYGYDPNEIQDLLDGIHRDIDNDVSAEEISDKYDIVHEMAQDLINAYSLGDLTTIDLLHSKGLLWNFNLTDEARDEVNQILQEFHWDILDYNLCYEHEGNADLRRELMLQKPIGSVTADQLTDIYLYNRQVLQWIDDRILDTTDIAQLEALYRLKKVLFNSANVRRNFMKLDGTYAKTYMEMLQDIDPYMARKLEKAEGDDLDNMLLYIIEKLEKLFDDPALKYIFANTPGSAFDLLKQYIRKAIELFKASSVQLDAINIVLEIGGMGDDAENNIRVICQPYRIEDISIPTIVHPIDDVKIDIELNIDDDVFIEPKAAVQ